MSRNLPLFIAFRLLFNARFYYPIFAVIQLDYGLSMAQFAILNAVWAATIVVLEIPSGALADRIGRKRMIVLAASLMVCEMALIAFVPLGNATLVFWIWVLNRILSGAAEAAASGADEALAYDSIPAAEREARWPKVLSRLMLLSSVAFAAAMLIGSAVYDASFINGVLAWFGSDLELEKHTVIRFPIYLTLLTALAALPVAFSMKEPAQDTECGGECSVWSNVLGAGAWILRTPVVLAIILAALVHDTLVRLFLTMNSEYYRLIEIPDAAFGIIGAASAAIGIFVPKIAERLVVKGRAPNNYLLVSALTLAGLVGVALAVPIYGVAVIVFFSFSFGLLNFFTSHYLNAQADSARRATVLSFKGLALNLGFGAISLLYAALLRGLRELPNLPSDNPTTSDPAFPTSLLWLPGTFVTMLVPLVAFYFIRVRGERQPGAR